MAASSLPVTCEWETISEIGRGAFAEVYKVRTAANLICAAKYIRLPYQHEIMARMNLENIIRDNKWLCELEHRNLVKLIDMKFLQRDVTVTVLMEFVDGSTLRTKIRTDGTLPDGTIRGFSKQICSALEYLHSKKVIHRNISSSTVMIVDDSEVKLIDYGISIQLLDDVSTQSSGTPRGHPHYLAPELMQEAETPTSSIYSRGSDIWAFGCVVYEMAAGKKPHADCKGMLALVNAVKNQSAPELPDQCSEALKKFYRACVVKARRDRMPAAELLKHEFLVQGVE